MWATRSSCPSSLTRFSCWSCSDGRGISVGNPHLPWVGEYQWHQSQITIPGRLNVIGASFVGLPAIALGHTEGMAWSGTMVDAVRPFTLFELKLVPGTSTSYLIDGKPEPMVRKDISVPARQRQLGLP